MRGKAILKTTATAIAILLSTQAALGQPVPVELVETPDGQWQLLRDGQPYFIMGAGGSGPKDMLAAAGANTFRTWGVGPDLGQQLDQAQQLGLTVVVGHWLGHPRHGFDYNDLDAVAEQFARVRQDVLAYKDHPALLLWAVGNEMEGFAEGDDAAVWSHVQALAAMIKDLDPHHPTMTVTAEIGGRRVEAVHSLCPDIDIMGINSYGGLPSVPERYRKLGGTKPIVITEFGPPGTWEIAHDGLRGPARTDQHRKGHGLPRRLRRPAASTAGGPMPGRFRLHLGLQDGGDVDLVRHVPAQRGQACRRGRHDRSLERAAAGRISVRKSGTSDWSEPNVVQPGDTVRVALDVADPEGCRGRRPLAGAGRSDRVHDRRRRPVGAAGTRRHHHRIIVPGRDPGHARRRDLPPLPDGPRRFRRGRRGQRSAQGRRARRAARGSSCRWPFYADGAPQPWAPSGWMGGYDALTLDLESTDSPHSGATCLEVLYDAPGMWVGVAWQHPANDWGDQPGGYDLTGAKKLTFWARGDEGGERIDFAVGMLGSDKEYPDTAKAELKGVKLKREWKRYSIDLDDEDLTRIKTPFVWTMGGRGRPVTFYLDDIQFE